MTVQQDVALYAGLLDVGQRVVHELRPGATRGCTWRAAPSRWASEQLAAGDAAAVSGAGALDIVGGEASEVLLFDLA